MYQELLMKHRQQISDMEMHQDSRVAEALCDHWKVKDWIVSHASEYRALQEYFSVFFCHQKLRSHWSKRLGEQAREVFLTSILTQSQLSASRCEELWLDLEQELVSQLQQAECTIKLQLEAMRAQLDQDGQVGNIWQIVNKFVVLIVKHYCMSNKSQSQDTFAVVALKVFHYFRMNVL